MRVKLQLVLCTDDGREETVTDIVSLKKDCHRIEHLGLTLMESKQLLNLIQKTLLPQQIDRYVASRSRCPDCGVPLKTKNYTTRSFRTLFGTFKLPSPPLVHCLCKRRKTVSFRPLSALLTESVSPELLFIAAKWSSLASYGLTVKALKDFLPLDASLAINTVRHDTLKVAERLEAGEDAVRNLQLSMSPEAEHIVDWWHVSQKLTILDQYGKGLVHCDPVLGESIRDKIDRLKWSLWNGNVYKALYKIDDIESLIYNFEESYPKFKQLEKAVDEFRPYLRNNAHLIPNYGERYRNGEAITTSFVESTVNQVVSKRFCKKQQMQWSKRGAHPLLQARVKTLNREWAAVFKQWYPDLEVEEWEEAA